MLQQISGHFYASYLQLQNGIVKIDVKNALGQVFKPKLQIKPFNFESNLSSTLIKTLGLFGPVATLAKKLVLNPNKNPINAAMTSPACTASQNYKKKR